MEHRSSDVQYTPHPLQPFENLLFSSAPIHNVFLAYMLINLSRDRTKCSLRDIQLQLGDIFQKAWIPSKRVVNMSVATGVQLGVLHIEPSEDLYSANELLTLTNLCLVK